MICVIFVIDLLLYMESYIVYLESIMPVSGKKYPYVEGGGWGVVFWVVAETNYEIHFLMNSLQYSTAGDMLCLL